MAARRASPNTTRALFTLSAFGAHSGTSVPPPAGHRPGRPQTPPQGTSVSLAPVTATTPRGCFATAASPPSRPVGTVSDCPAAALLTSRRGDGSDRAPETLRPTRSCRSTPPHAGRFHTPEPSRHSASRFIMRRRSCRIRRCGASGTLGAALAQMQPDLSFNLAVRLPNWPRRPARATWHTAGAHTWPVGSRPTQHPPDGHRL